jgi:2-haloalkanoic acid dehalogenase type II
VFPGMGERWATFDCYGTLIDWEGGIRGAVAELWPDADPQRLLEHYHAVEPRIQADRDLAYREVMARALAAIAAIDALDLPGGRGQAIAESLPSWSPFPEVPDSLREAREQGWKLAALSNTDPDLLAASIAAIGVPFDLQITAAEAGSYKPAPGHWEAFRERAGEIDAHVHVAASLFHDIEPCARMGLPAIWINRLDEASELPRAAELPDLRSLAEALEAASELRRPT